MHKPKNPTASELDSVLHKLTAVQAASSGSHQHPQQYRRQHIRQPTIPRHIVNKLSSIEEIDETATETPVKCDGADEDSDSMDIKMQRNLREQLGVDDDNNDDNNNQDTNQIVFESVLYDDE
jgi:hypothetical protein